MLARRQASNTIFTVFDRHLLHREGLRKCHRSRVSRLLDDKQGRGLRVSTFHSLGLDILRAEHKTLGYKSTITLFDEQDRLTLLRNLISQGLKECDIDQVDQYNWQIGQWKNAFVRPEQAVAMSDATSLPAAAPKSQTNIF